MIKENVFLRSHEGRKILMLKIGKSPRGSDTRAVWIDGGIHARLDRVRSKEGRAKCLLSKASIFIQGVGCHLHSDVPPGQAGVRLQAHRRRGQR